MNKPIKLLYKLTESELKNIIKDSLLEFYDEKYVTLRLINEDYHHTLNEEYGIDLETEIETDKIVDEIRESVKNDAITDIDGNGLKNYLGSIEHTYKQENLTINYRIINFINEAIFDKYYGLYNFKSEYKKDNNTLYVIIGMYNGQFIAETFHNSIQHELSHIFDRINNNGYVIPEKEKWMYKIATSQIEHPISDLSFELANAVYISFKSEQIAMCNGIDAMFRNRPNHDILYSIQQTNEYKLLYYLKKVISNIDAYSTLIKSIYKMTPEKMLKRLNLAYKDYLRRLSRIEIKYK